MEEFRGLRPCERAVGSSACLGLAQVSFLTLRARCGGSACLGRAQVSFISPREAQARANLLLALTWDPKAGHGAALLPPHTTSAARAMPRPSDAESSALHMHKWASLNSAVSSTAQQRAAPESPPASAVHSLVSYSLVPVRLVCA